MRSAFAAMMLATTLVALARADAPGWTPAAWAAENTVELLTAAQGEDPHWFPVWVVTLDGQLYVRLGSRAAARFDGNVTKPVVGVRIAGKTFERVRGVVVSDMVERVTAAMTAKYWLQGDVFVRHMNHPYTMRLEPEPASGN